MSDIYNIPAQPRTRFGKKLNALRKEGILPANIFAKNKDSVAVQVNYLQFNKMFEKAGETSLIDLQVEGNKDPFKVLISSYDLHPITGKYIHVNFHQVDLTQTVTANVPLEFIGESVVVKLGAQILTQLEEVEVEALPADIPSEFQIDLSLLKEIGDSLHISDIKTSDKVTITNDPDTVLVIAQEIKEQVEEEVVPATTPIEASPTGKSSDESEKSE